METTLKVSTIINQADRILQFVNHKFFQLSTFILGIMSIPIFFDVVLRFVVGKSVPGIIEIEEFMLVCIVFLSAAWVQTNPGHIRIDILVSRFPVNIRTLVKLGVDLLSFLIVVSISWQTFFNAVEKFGRVSFVLQIPISIFVFAAGFGMLLLSLTLLKNTIHSISEAFKQNNWYMPVLALTVAASLFAFPIITSALWWEPNNFYLGIAGMLFLFVLIFLGMPICFSMPLVGFLGMWILTGNYFAAFSMLGSTPYSETASFILCVAPLFIFMGELALVSGISNDLFDTANKWLGWLPGGLSMASIAGCAGFAAVCGDSMSTALTMGSVALPEMKKKNYSPSLAAGGIAAGGTLGILIPPSVGFIFYALVTETSIGELFLAGIVPGILLSGLFILCVYIIAVKIPGAAPRGNATSFKEKVASLKGVIGMLLLFVLILGGILVGMFSPTEGGAIGAVGAFVFALAKRRINKQALAKATRSATSITCRLLFILMGVRVLSTFLMSTRLPLLLADTVVGLQVNRYIVLAAIIFMYMLLGCILNVIPILLLTLPTIFPTVVALDFNPIWFGVISVLLMEMGQITPPIGIIVFAIHSVAEDIPLGSIFRGVVPFILCIIVCVVILTIFPQIALFLPNLLMN